MFFIEKMLFVVNQSPRAVQYLINFEPQKGILFSISVLCSLHSPMIGTVLA